MYTLPMARHLATLDPIRHEPEVFGEVLVLLGKGTLAWKDGGRYGGFQASRGRQGYSD